MSLTSVTIISPEAANGRNVVALGVTKAFAAAKKTAVFRPAVCRKETFTDVLLESSNSGLSREQSVGVCPKRARTDKEGSRADIVAAYTEVTALADIMRMSIKGREILTARENIRYVEQYMFIERLRYTDKLIFLNEIPDSMMDYYIPKLILQPILENSVIHGISEILGRGMYT